MFTLGNPEKWVTPVTSSSCNSCRDKSIEERLAIFTAHEVCRNTSAGCDEHAAKSLPVLCRLLRQLTSSAGGNRFQGGRVEAYEVDMPVAEQEVRSTAMHAPKVQSIT